MDSPVINGCSGNCCERFTMPFSLEELKRNNEAASKGESQFIDDYGTMRHALNDTTREQVYDMLIPLGFELYDPQEPFYTLGEKVRYALFVPEEEPLTQADVEKYNKRVFHMQDLLWERMDEKGERRIHHYSCKHFDTKNRICTIYETRPNMCRHFGRGCRYKGCGFQALLELQAAQEQKALNHHRLLNRIKEYEFDDEPWTQTQKDNYLFLNAVFDESTTENTDTYSKYKSDSICN